MTVIIAENTPAKVRGLLKRWFVEPKPNVFVGSVNAKTREKVLQYILKYSPADLALLVIFDDDSSQGFCVRRYRDTSRCEKMVSGHYLLAVLQAALAPETPPPPEAGSPAIDKQALFDRLDECFITYQIDD